MAAPAWRVDKCLHDVAIIDIKLDSLENEYRIAAKKLQEIEKQIQAEDNHRITVTIPDVSVEKIMENKQAAQRNLEKIKVLRSKKIIHL